MSETDFASQAVEVVERQPAGESLKNRLCLIGAKRIIRLGISELLRKYKMEVNVQYATEGDFQDSLSGQDELDFDLVLLILSNGGSYSSIHRIREALEKIGKAVPLVILSEHVGRGEVYAALRIGAKAYLDLNCDSEELVRAIKMAASGKVYLSPDVAELLVNDVSEAFKPARSPRLPNVELSRREVEIVQLLCEGLSSKEIARHLHLSVKTIENHRYNIYRKCEVDSIATLMRHAIQHGLVSI
jgi:DNA-binding NarL/FixJ family response regulator